MSFYDFACLSATGSYANQPATLDEILEPSLPYCSSGIALPHKCNPHHDDDFNSLPSSGIPELDLNSWPEAFADADFVHSTAEQALSPLGDMAGLKCVGETLAGTSQQSPLFADPLLSPLQDISLAPAPFYPDPASILFTTYPCPSLGDFTVNPRALNSERATTSSNPFPTLPSQHVPVIPDLLPSPLSYSESTDSSPESSGVSTLASPSTVNFSSPWSSESTLCDDADFEPPFGLRSLTKSATKSSRPRACKPRSNDRPAPYRRIRGEQGPRTKQVPLPKVLAALDHISKSADMQCPFCPTRIGSRRIPDITRHVKTHNHAYMKQEFQCLGEQIAKDGTLVWEGGCEQHFSRRDALRRHLQTSQTCRGDLNTIISYLKTLNRRE